jgi:hypothetical protein
MLDVAGGFLKEKDAIAANLGDNLVKRREF